MSAETVTDFPADRERRLFFYLSIAIAAWVTLGFGIFILVGISSFDAPWWVHLHAVSFVAWIVLYVLQNRLVVNGELERHRRLGKIGAYLAVWMVIVGLLVTPATISAGRVPPFFTPAIFLALDTVNILCFGGLVLAALRMRARSDWHKRLMLCATISVIAPAFGRLLALAGASNPAEQRCGTASLSCGSGSGGSAGDRAISSGLPLGRWRDFRDGTPDLRFVCGAGVSRVGNWFVPLAWLMHRGVTLFLRLGWPPYYPSGKAEVCSVCGASYYPQGSGEGWKCGA